MERKKLTGYPSIDKPWLKYYSEETVNTPQSEYTVFENIHRNNAKYTDNIALEYFGNKITYKILFENIEATKRALLHYGITKNSKVILYTSSTPEVVYIVLALCRIGAVANMINPLFSNEQVVDRINETNATMLIALDQLYNRVADAIKKTCINQVVIVPVTNSMPLLVRTVAKLKLNTKYSKKTIIWNDFIKSGLGVAPMPDTQYEKDCPVVMVYSSGTTGASKGIVLTNDGINATISHYLSPDFPYKRGNRYLQMIPIWFSTGMVLSILMPICLGITVVLEPVYSKESFVKDLKKYKPNMTLATTSLWLYAMNCKMLKKTNLSFLTYPITGGELVLPRVECALNSFLREHGCSAPLIKGWGMCELGSTISSDSLSYVKPGAAGYPISHVVVAAFDPVTNKEMKYNERGELRVLSPCRMKEYFRNTDETNKFFWNDENGSAWGCTGDIGYIDEDGFVYVLGRINDVFISHKKRKMYCFDVEAIILKNPSIAQCEVVGIQTDKGYDIPVAHLILEEHCDINSEAIIWQAYKSCIENLETDCVPQGYKICNSFPIKNSGKRDMEALKQDRIGFLVPQGNRLREVSF